LELARLLPLLERALPHSRDDSRRTLVNRARIARIGRQGLIFKQGDRMPLVLIVDGHAAFQRTTVEGRLLIVGVANPGALIGLTSMSGVKGMGEMVALTDAVVAMWDGAELRDLVAADADLGLDVIDGLALFLVLMTEKLDGYLHQDARRRVIRVLARHRALFFADPPILSRAHLPGLVGTSREMTGRVLRDLEREGAVARVGRTGLRLLDADRLSETSEGDEPIALDRRRSQYT